MKYPQLVSMPSAVQDWLDEQLEARGIDAVVYTRYILSLLQRDTLDLPDDLLTNKEVGRRSRKRCRREDYWDVWDCEQLKRSAAVECLMSASDQKCGIEKLVDELCAKLKEIQNEGENILNAPVSCRQSPARSLQDQVHKYYAAFPPLTSKATETGASVITLIPSAWAGKKVLTNSLSKQTEQGNLSKLAEEIKDYKETGNNNMKHRGHLQDQLLDIEKEVGYGFAWNMASERNELFSDFCPIEFGSNNGSDMLRVFKCNKQNQYGFDGNDTAVKPGVCRRLYERQIEDDEMVLEKLENIIQDNLEGSEGNELSPKQVLDENNLAQLIAKFDHSIEAIWNPEDAAPSPSACTNSDEIWSLDFQQLLSSPSEQLLTVELCSLNSKPSSENNSFIQCGTNIINSIWSDNPSKEQEENRMDCVLGDQNTAEENFKETAVNDLETCCKEKLNVGENSQVVLVDDGNTETITDNSTDLKSDSNEECSILFGNLEKSDFILNGSPKERSKISWNKLESFPSYFTSVTWGNLNYTVGGLPHTICNQKWSDAGDYGHTNIFTSSCFCPLKPKQSVKATAEEKESCRFNTLNHNREDSSFTEVIPKNGTESSSANDTELNSIQEADSAGNEDQKKHGDDVENDIEKDEEDLLTSNRTHFRPIRQESLDSHNTAGCYADGTTFAISNNLEDVSFKRSESGALYLENDVGAESPRKYMEYKEKEPYGGRLSPSSVACFSDDNNFIPKFCVKQTEKCCQTEAADEVVTSDEEIDPKRSRQEDSDVSDFFFPGDDQCAEKIINCLENDENVEPCLTCRCQGSVAPCVNHKAKLSSKDHCKTPSGNPEVGIQNWSSTMKPSCNCNNNNLLAWNNGWLKTSNPGLPKNVWEASENEETSKLPQSWYDIWCGTPDPGSAQCQDCCESPVHAGVESGKSLQYCRLRKELSEDGEQLLSDLSYLQHLYLGSDDQGEHELLPPQKLQCLSPPGEELQLYDDETRYTRSLVDYQSGKEELSGTEMKSADDKISSSILLKKLLLPTKPEAECKPNERPFDARAAQKDRKRRHSASQRTCNFYLDGNCERSHDLATVPRQFWGDSSCMKGLACSSFHGCVRAFRPVTL